MNGLVRLLTRDLSELKVPSWWQTRGSFLPPGSVTDLWLCKLSQEIGTKNNALGISTLYLLATSVRWVSDVSINTVPNRMLFCANVSIESSLQMLKLRSIRNRVFGIFYFINAMFYRIYSNREEATAECQWRSSSHSIQPYALRLNESPRITRQ